MNQTIRTFFVLLLFVLSSCAAASLREAQDAFNAGSAREAKIRASGLEFQAGLTGHLEAVLEYRTALDELDEQIRSHKKELRDDELLGTAYLLKALCLWRIIDLTELEEPLDESPEAGANKELSDVLTTLNTEYENSSIVLGTRDQVLLRALPGLRDHDRGLRATGLEGDHGAGAYFSSAMSAYDRALDTPGLPPNHSIRVYVQLAQLATLNAWQAAALVAITDEDRQREYLKGRVRDPAGTITDALLKVAADSGDSDLTNHIKKMIGLLGI